MRLHGKTALVTGASSGIGKAVAEALRKEGATVVAADINCDAPVRLDVASESAWHRVMESLPHLDIFVSSAGISQAGSIADTTLEDWRRMMAVTLDGAFLGVRAAAAKMRAGGSIVLISSVSGSKAVAGAAAYCTAKAGVCMLARAAALEFKAAGIRVNSVSPGGVATPLWKTMPFWDNLIAQHGSEEAAWAALGGIDPATPSLHRMAFPEEIARTVLFLASDESAHITGTDIVIDAGYSA